jgi:hypothetical protein
MKRNGKKNGRMKNPSRLSKIQKRKNIVCWRCFLILLVKFISAMSVITISTIADGITQGNG